MPRAAATPRRAPSSAPARPAPAPPARAATIPPPRWPLLEWGAAGPPRPGDVAAFLVVRGDCPRSVRAAVQFDALLTARRLHGGVVLDGRYDAPRAPRQALALARPVAADPTGHLARWAGALALPLLVVVHRDGEVRATPDIDTPRQLARQLRQM